MAASSEITCADGAALASGAPDSSLLAREASHGIRAFWCERYDSAGVPIRFGRYQEIYANGQVRVRSQYVDEKLSGPVEIRNDDGALFVRGFLKAGDWNGNFQIFHENGTVWFESLFRQGQLEGPLRTHHSDGGLESETQFQGGREDGLARSFYSSTAGGRLKSEVHVEADQIVGPHRLLNQNGNLIQSIDRTEGPPLWRRIPARPAAPGFSETEGPGQPIVPATDAKLPTPD